MASLSASNHVARVLSVANHVADVDASSRIANSWRRCVVATSSIRRAGARRRR